MSLVPGAVGCPAPLGKLYSKQLLSYSHKHHKISWKRTSRLGFAGTEKIKDREEKVVSHQLPNFPLMQIPLNKCAV